MKKLLTVLAFAMVAILSAKAQGKIYCELLGTQQFLSKKVTVQVDFGQESRYFADNRLVDADGKVIVFNSMVDAMNYMGTMGWEFEQAYVVTIGSGSGSSNVYHWLLSKFVGDEGDSTALKTKDIIYKEQREAAAAAAAAEQQQ